MRYKILLVLVFLLQACTSPEKDGELSGTISFDPAPETFEGLVIDMVVYDNSIEDDSGAIERKSYKNIENEPFSFEISYDKNILNDNGTYYISATVFEHTEESINTKYLTKVSQPVINNDVISDIELVVESVE